VRVCDGVELDRKLDRRVSSSRARHIAIHRKLSPRCTGLVRSNDGGAVGVVYCSDDGRTEPCGG
jgi:hypothetical protein